MRLYRNPREAEFLDRPNRFVVRALAPGGEILTAHCQNPGRMQELLLPGAGLLLERADNPGRSTAYTLAAVHHRGHIIPLRSVQANQIAEQLILPRLYPDMRALQREVPHHRSRFDFLIHTPRGEIFLEVKACTLVEEQVAMFPDAPSARALRHLNELEELVRRGGRADILFVVMNPEAARFLPNIHTDPAFSRALLEARGRVGIRAASIRVDAGGSAQVHTLKLPLDFLAAETNEGDRGAYLLIVHLRHQGTVYPGALGPLSLKAGYYVYVGSAMKNLEARLRRHRRRGPRGTSTPCWHLLHAAQRSPSPSAAPAGWSAPWHRILRPWPLAGSPDSGLPTAAATPTSSPSRTIRLPRVPL